MDLTDAQRWVLVIAASTYCVSQAVIAIAFALDIIFDWTGLKWGRNK